MKKSLVVIISILFICSLVSAFPWGGSWGDFFGRDRDRPSYVPYTCSDSDSSKSFDNTLKIKGKTSNNRGVSQTDFCDSENILIEYSCANPIKSAKYSCSGKFGDNYVCEDGACVEKIIPTEQNSSEMTCNDSDGGVDYYTKGNINYFYKVHTADPDFYGSHISSDQCLDDGSLLEFSCDYYSPDKMGPSKKYLCPNGCKDGACVEKIIPTEQNSSEMTCTENDKGKNYFEASSMVTRFQEKSYVVNDFCVQPIYCEVVSANGTVTSSKQVSECSKEKYSQDKYVPGTCHICGHADDITSCSGDDCFINEYYCSGSPESGYDADADVYYRCPNGCVEGACIPTEQNSSEMTCNDSDGGVNYYEKGKIYSINDLGNESVFVDYCRVGAGNSSVIEYFCNPNNLVINAPYLCENGCVEGACIPTEQNSSEMTCNDSDGGVNYYEKGVRSGSAGIHYDSCKVSDALSAPLTDNGDYLLELYCENGVIKEVGGVKTYGFVEDSKIYKCPNGCVDGACVSQGDTTEVFELFEGDTKVFTSGGKSYEINISYIDADEVKLLVNGQEASTAKLTEGASTKLNDGSYLKILDIAKIEVVGNVGKVVFTITPSGEVSKDCDGCLIDGKCFSWGYREGLNFCSVNFGMVSQKKEGSSCTNNFECVDNLCIGGQCISGNLFQRMLEWFRNLLG